MLKRTVTGAVYVAVIAGFFVLRQFVDYRLFDVLVWFFCALGTFEVSRAIKGGLEKSVYFAAIIFGVLFVPIYCLFQYAIIGKAGGYAALILAGAFLIFSVSYSGIKCNFKNLSGNILPFIYPSLLLLTILLTNDFNDNSFIALLLVFVISPVCDTFAYLVGMTYNKIRKGKAKKFCPRLSPKKTWAGAIGGVVGGIIASVVLLYIVGFESDKLSPVLAFIIIGVVAAVLTEVGDLFESYIKRRVGIKDMGNLMPGHGGIMDRIDGMTFAAAFIYFIFLIL